MMRMTFDKYKSFAISIYPPPYAKFGRGLDLLEHNILRKDMRLIDLKVYVFFCLRNFKSIQIK